MHHNYKVYCSLDSPPFVNELDYPRLSHVISEIESFSEQISFIETEGQKYCPKLYRKSFSPVSNRMVNEYMGFVVEVDIQDDGKVNSVLSYKNAERVLYQTYYFTAMAQIAYPRSLNMEVMEVYLNDEYYNYLKPGSFIYEPYGDLSRNWPKLRNISIKEAYAWLSRKNISFNGFSKSIANRAVLAVVNIFSHNDYSVSHHLMWSMYGIEALYNNGEVKVRQQILRRTQIVLGKHPSLPNTVGKLYNWRSVYAHGKLDLPMLYSEANILEEKQRKFYNDVSFQIKLAIQILIASIQELILQDKDEFDIPVISTYEKIKAWLSYTFS